MNQRSTSSSLKPVTPRGERTRRALVDAAETVFGKNGYDAASIADITREADVALGTFYVYFHDKKELFIELVDNLGARLRQELATAVKGIDDRLEAEEAGVRAFFAFLKKHRLIYRIVRQAEFVDPPTFRRYYDRFAEGYARGLEASMGKGEIQKFPPETLAYCLMGLFDFLGMRYVLFSNTTDLDEVVDTAVRFIRGGIAMSTEPSRPRKRKTS